MNSSPRKCLLFAAVLALPAVALAQGVYAPGLNPDVVGATPGVQWAPEQPRPQDQMQQWQEEQQQRSQEMQRQYQEEQQREHQQFQDWQGSQQSTQPPQWRQ